MQNDLAVFNERDERISSELDEKNASTSKIVQPLAVIATKALTPLVSDRLVCLSLMRNVTVFPLSGSMNDRACSTPRLIRAAGYRMVP